MLEIIKFGFLTLIGALCVIFGAMALQESSAREAFLYYVI